jgi:CRP-like cAMP-binding protein
MRENKNIYQLFKNQKLIKVSKNTVISDKKEYANGIFLIKKGAVKIFNNSGTNNFILWIGFEGDLIGVDAAFSKEKSPNSYVSIQNTELYFMSYEDFLAALGKNQNILVDVMRYLSEKSDELEARILNINRKSVSANFAELLLSLNHKNIPNLIPNIISTADIANLIGTTKNYVYKTIQRMEDKGIISFKDRKLQIINKELLKKLVNSDN